MTHRPLAKVRLLIFVELMGITAVVVDLTCGPANLSRHSRCLVADY